MLSAARSEPVHPEVAPDPLVSVIITTYNHGRFLSESIGSVLQQTWKHWELIIIDDGSTDDTSDIAAAYPVARYIYQQNRGLSAARNTGTAHANGEFVVFLDADDLLYPHALAVNLGYFRVHPECAFVSGGHNLVDADKKIGYVYDNIQHEADHYLSLIRDNYIGMHGAVMYRAEILRQYPYDETLPACEDFDIYLRIARNHPIYSHLESLAAYRIHGRNMSQDFALMASQYLRVLKKDTDFSYGPEVKQRYRQGIRNCKSFYAKQLIPRFTHRALWPTVRFRDIRLVVSALSWHDTVGYLHRGLKKVFRYGQKASRLGREKIKVFFGENSERFAPAVNQVSMGHLRRLTPLSRKYGFDRGGPIDRYYMERFLKEHSSRIRGRVLEIGDNAYTRTFGGNNVEISDVFHVDASNPKATLFGDLSDGASIASDQFDCIILTQTLHLIYDFRGAIRTCYRILKPGGTLLVTVPGISQIENGEWSKLWYWSFTGNSIQKLLDESFDPRGVTVETHGNVMAATAFLYGMGRQEISDLEKDTHDPKYQVIIAASATKTGKP